MSCFAGRMNEYERISLDRFDGKNLQSTVYFLSHLHEDHTVGLGQKLLFQRLKSNKGIFLYCSEVTELLLQASVKYKHLAPYTKSININTPTILEIPDPLFDEKEKVTVTFLPAFHCPGSVMCLFEGHEGTVIYTGDFRWEHFHIEQMHHLRSAESVKPVKSLYVDTTFCTPDNLYIPSRQQCIDAVYYLIREWISQSAQHVVYISLRAQYGHEPLLNAVASRLNKKVHVSKLKAEVYDNIQEFHGNFTADGTTTQIHACDKQVKVNLDGEMVSCRQTHDADKVLVILPTTMYFTQFQHLTLDKIIKRIDSNFYRACYSFHSSYTEIKDLLSYLKPDKVFPNVKPPNDSTLATTQHRLNTMLKECLTSGSGDITQAESQEEVKQLGTLKTQRGRAALKRKATVSISDSESLDFGTPTKTKTYISQSQDSGLSSSKRGRGRGSGKGKVATESSSQSVPSTRRSSRRLAATAFTAGDTDSQQVTPKKVRRSESPDLFVSPVKHETSDISDIHSSYAGSHRSDSELDLTQSSQPSLEFGSSGEEILKVSDTDWSTGSFMAAINSSSLDETGFGCVCLLDDVEQTDDDYQDVSQVDDLGLDEADGFSLDELSCSKQDALMCSDEKETKPKPESTEESKTDKCQPEIKNDVTHDKEEISVDKDNESVVQKKDEVDKAGVKLVGKRARKGKKGGRGRGKGKAVVDPEVIVLDETSEKSVDDSGDVDKMDISIEKESDLTVSRKTASIDKEHDCNESKTTLNSKEHDDNEPETVLKSKEHNDNESKTESDAVKNLETENGIKNVRKSKRNLPETKSPENEQIDFPESVEIPSLEMDLIKDDETVIKKERKDSASDSRATSDTSKEQNSELKIMDTVVNDKTVDVAVIDGAKVSVSQLNASKEGVESGSEKIIKVSSLMNSEKDSGLKTINCGENNSIANNGNNKSVKEDAEIQRSPGDTKSKSRKSLFSEKVIDLTDSTGSSSPLEGGDVNALQNESISGEAIELSEENNTNLKPDTSEAEAMDITIKDNDELNIVSIEKADAIDEEEGKHHNNEGELNKLDKPAVAVNSSSSLKNENETVIKLIKDEENDGIAEATAETISDDNDLSPVLLTIPREEHVLKKQSAEVTELRTGQNIDKNQQQSSKKQISIKINPQVKTEPAPKKEVRKLRFSRSNSFGDITDLNDDASIFGYTPEIPSTGIPDPEIYQTKWAFCFEPDKKIVDEYDKFMSELDVEPIPSGSGTEGKCTSHENVIISKMPKDIENHEYKNSEVIGEEMEAESSKESTDNDLGNKEIEIDLTGDDIFVRELDKSSVKTGKTMSKDANVSYEDKGGKKLMRISFSKSKDKKTENSKKSYVDEVKVKEDDTERKINKPDVQSEDKESKGLIDSQKCENTIEINSSGESKDSETITIKSIQGDSTDSENINQVEIISSGEAEKLETNAKLEDEMSVDNDEVNDKRTEQEKKSEVSDDKTCKDNGEGKEMIEVESSQEWLSVSKAIETKAPDLTSRKRKKRKNHDTSLKKKKSKNDEEKASKSASKVGSSKDGETALYEELDNDESNLGQLDGLSEKEKEDRAEVRRQAMGFVCETDSDSDTDESTIPPSPTGSVLYDDYIELSSDSDKEDDQNTGNKEDNFSSTEWLTSRNSANEGSDSSKNRNAGTEKPSDSESGEKNKQTASQVSVAADKPSVDTIPLENKVTPTEGGYDEKNNVEQFSEISVKKRLENESIAKAIARYRNQLCIVPRVSVKSSDSQPRHNKSRGNENKSRGNENKGKDTVKSSRWSAAPSQVPVSHPKSGIAIPDRLPKSKTSMRHNVYRSNRRRNYGSSSDQYSAVPPPAGIQEYKKARSRFAKSRFGAPRFIPASDEFQPSVIPTYAEPLNPTTMQLSQSNTLAYPSSSLSSHSSMAKTFPISSFPSNIFSADITQLKASIFAVTGITEAANGPSSIPTSLPQVSQTPFPTYAAAPYAGSQQSATMALNSFGANIGLPAQKPSGDELNILVNKLDEVKQLLENVQENRASQGSEHSRNSQDLHSKKYDQEQYVDNRRVRDERDFPEDRRIRRSFEEEDYEYRRHIEDDRRRYEDYHRRRPHRDPYYDYPPPPHDSHYDYPPHPHDPYFEERRQRHREDPYGSERRRPYPLERFDDRYPPHTRYEDFPPHPLSDGRLPPREPYYDRLDTRDEHFDPRDNMRPPVDPYYRRRPISPSFDPEGSEYGSRGRSSSTHGRPYLSHGRSSVDHTTFNHEPSRAANITPAVPANEPKQAPVEAKEPKILPTRILSRSGKILTFSTTATVKHQASQQAIPKTAEMKTEERDQSILPAFLTGISKKWTKSGQY